MAGLHLGYLALGIGRGDEVLCTAMSHQATAHAIELVGARPIFVDCNIFGNIDVLNLEKAITKNTKAIALVHYLGVPCNMDKIMEIANNYDLKVIEDCAHALGTRYNKKHVGLWGDCGSFSFYPSKHITTGEGGMFVTKDVELWRKAKKIARFGKCNTDGKYYDVDTLGLNYRMSEMQSALGRSQLKRIEKNLADRRSKGLLYNMSIDFGVKVHHSIEGHYAYSIDLGSKIDRDIMLKKLKDKGVEATLNFPHPINRLTYYRNKYGWRKKLFPRAIIIADSTLVLPVGWHITEEDINYICEVINE
jgi:dTDP-4-amino-4,6-dideoxygalactose transaminase